MSGTMYQGTLSRRHYIVLGEAGQRNNPPVGLGFGRFGTELLRDRLDLTESEPHGLVGQPLTVGRVTKWAG